MRWLIDRPRYLLTGSGPTEHHFLYSLSHTATVVTVVRSSSGQVVRTLESGVLHEGNSPLFSFYSVAWDGRGDDAALLPDGPYSVHVIASNGGGSDQDEQPTGIDSRGLGSLTSSLPGAVVDGDLDVVFTPGNSRIFDEVFVSVGGFAGRRLTQLDADSEGNLRATIPAAELTSGPAIVSMSAYWTDPLGFQHGQRDDRIPIAVTRSVLPLAVQLSPAGGAAPWSRS